MSFAGSTTLSGRLRLSIRWDTGFRETWLGRVCKRGWKCNEENSSIPSGNQWKWKLRPVRQAHQYIRGIPARLLTLFRPATGELRAEPVEHTTNAVLHPWLKEHLLTIMEQCPPAPEVVPEGRRWQDWDIYSAASQLDRFFPPVRMLLIWDNLAGHKSPSLTKWCAEHGILLLSTPNGGMTRISAKIYQ
jgi:hypothetical protein